jgi:Cu/Ag efflux protein CusF
MFPLRPVLAWLLLAGACGDEPRARPAVPADATYTAEGRVARLPPESAEIREVSIAHEAIAGFRDREGHTVGMEAMTMQFEVAPDVSFEGIAAGDRIRFTFEVRWESRPMLYVTELSEAR